MQFFSFPENISVCILSTWTGIFDLGKLDMACTNGHARTALLECMQCPGFVCRIPVDRIFYRSGIAIARVGTNDFVRWISHRRIRPMDWAISAQVDIVSQLLLNRVETFHVNCPIAIHEESTLRTLFQSTKLKSIYIKEISILSFARIYSNLESITCVALSLFPVHTDSDADRIMGLLTNMMNVTDLSIHNCHHYKLAEGLIILADQASYKRFTVTMISGTKIEISPIEKRTLIHMHLYASQCFFDLFELFRTLDYQRVDIIAPLVFINMPHWERVKYTGNRKDRIMTDSFIRRTALSCC